MTAQPRRHRDPERGPADSPWRASSPPPEDDIAPRTASRIGRENDGWLVYSSDEVVRLTGLSRGRRYLITRQHLQQFVGIAS